MRFHKTQSDFIPIAPDVSDEELRTRVKTLTAEEFRVYEWLREAYSMSWIAETLMKKRSQIRAISREVYTKLGVNNCRDLIRFYAVLDKKRKVHFGPEEISEDPEPLLKTKNGH